MGLKSIRKINRLIVGYKEFGKGFFIHGNPKVDQILREKCILSPRARKLQKRILRKNSLLKNKILTQKENLLNFKLIL